jgi:S-DNA-T family DNA segregation ATPase FtsK/SpoIIIE
MGVVVLMILFVFLWPFWLLWRVMRRLVLAVPLLLFIALAIPFGMGNAQTLMLYIAIALVIWRFAHRESFDAYFWRFFRSSWRRWRVYDKHWKKVMRRLYLTDQQRLRTIYPKIIKVRCTKIQDRVLVDFLRSQDPDNFRDYASNLAHAFGAQMCYIRDDESGRCWLEFPRGKTLQDEVSAISIPVEPDLNNIEIGIYEDGSPWKIGLKGTHLYVGGSTGSGKGSVIWSIVRNLAPAIRDGWVEVWALDPKGGMELGPGKPLWARFASRYVEMAKVIHDCAEQMQARSHELSETTRTHKPSKKYPFVILLIDEMAALTLYMKESNKALYNQLIGDLGLILTEGRAVGYSVVACAQDPRKEVNSLRNLFPQRIGLQFDEESDVDLAMGKGAVSKGAMCHLIPKNPKHYPDWAGIAYELYSGETAARKTRTAHVTDSDIDFMVLEYAIKKAIKEHVSEDEDSGDRPASVA